MADNTNTTDSPAVKKTVADTTKQSSQAFFQDVWEVYKQDVGSGAGAKWAGQQGSVGDRDKINAAMQANGFLPDFQITGVETQGKHVGQLKVSDKDGANCDGYYINQKGLVVDENNKVVEATYQSTPDHPQGTTQRYTYNDKGDLTGVSIRQSANGKDGDPKVQQTNWSKKADGWHQVDDKGNDIIRDGKPIVSQSEVSVDDNGAYTIKNADGGVEKYNLDGSSTVQRADGSFVAKDGNGYVTDTKLANGQEFKFSYDNGQMSGVTFNGQKLNRNPDGSYSYMDPQEGEVKFDKITVDQFGGVNLTSTGSHYIMYLNPDGSSKFVDDSTGTTYLHDKTGDEVAEFTSKDGHIQTLKTKQGTWKYDQGSKKYSNDEGDVAQDITTDQWGNLRITYDDGHVTYVYSTGDQTTQANPFVPPPAQQVLPGQRQS